MYSQLAIFDPDDPTPEECRPTIDRLQRMMDGEDLAAILSDPHSQYCSNCRERVRAAVLVLTALCEPAATTSIADRTDGLVSVIARDRTSRRRQRWVGVGAAMAIAAAVLIAVFFRPTPNASERPTPELAQRPEAPSQRIGETLADAGNALESIGRRFTDSTLETPQILTPLAGAFNHSPGNPLAANLEPAARSLAELPEAARSSLETVTGPATRVFTRFWRDVTSVQPLPKVKS